MDQVSARLEALKLAREIVGTNDHAEIVRVAKAFTDFIFAASAGSP